MNQAEKSKRLRERLKLSLPVRVRCQEAADDEWMELSRLVDVTPFGAKLTLTHPTERGRLLHLTTPMPRQLRCFDHIEDQYRVWAIVRHVKPFSAEAATGQASDAGRLRFEVGVAFTGKHPPASHGRDPATLYELESPSADSSNLWMAHERLQQKDDAARLERSEATRIQMAVHVLVELFDMQGDVEAREQTVTENISRRGASVWTTLDAARGRFARLTSVEHGLSVFAAVRARRFGADGIPRLHLEFVGSQWPLEGIE